MYAMDDPLGTHPADGAPASEDDAREQAEAEAADAAAAWSACFVPPLVPPLGIPVGPTLHAGRGGLWRLCKRCGAKIDAPCVASRVVAVEGGDVGAMVVVREARR